MTTPGHDISSTSGASPEQRRAQAERESDVSAAYVERMGWNDEAPARFTATVVFTSPPESPSFNAIWEKRPVKIVECAVESEGDAVTSAVNILQDELGRGSATAHDAASSAKQRDIHEACCGVAQTIRNAIRAEAGTSPAEPTDDGWRPIESAVTDQGPVLIGGLGWVCEGHFIEDDTNGNEGWYAVGEHWTDVHAERLNPTHWRPLPSPPSACT